MAQKAAKTTAKRNSNILNKHHLLALLINGFFLLWRGLLFRRSFSGKTILTYVLLSLPAVIIQTFFEINSRPKYKDAAGTDLKRAGEDLEAKGLTEWMWDVLYWTWGCVIGAALLGDWVWWFYIAVPLYSVWLAWSTFGNVRSAMGMPAGAASDASGDGAGTGSKRQQKMEKRGGKVQYR